jgi:hypothetical protein
MPERALLGLAYCLVGDPQEFRHFLKRSATRVGDVQDTGRAARRSLGFGQEAVAALGPGTWPRPKEAVSPRPRGQRREHAQLRAGRRRLGHLHVKGEAHGPIQASASIRSLPATGTAPAGIW